MHGFIRVAVCSPKVNVGNPDKNVENILEVLANVGDASVVVFPELCITGYTCGDLFRQSNLIKASNLAISRLAKVTNDPRLIFVGAPIAVNNQLFNCAVAICRGEIIGIVPKTNIPNYAEFYESRWFRAANGSEPKFLANKE